MSNSLEIDGAGPAPAGIGHFSMAMKFDGKWHDTVSDAAKQFGVTPKTVQSWIDDGVIPKPPVKRQGRRLVQVFPAEYLKRARRMVEETTST